MCHMQEANLSTRGCVEDLMNAQVAEDVKACVNIEGSSPSDQLRIFLPRYNLSNLPTSTKRGEWK